MSQQDEIDLFWQHTVRAIDDVVACLDQAPVNEWNWKPTPTGNSLYALATHVIGSTEEHIVEGICGQPVGRNRDAEFASTGEDASAVHKRWREVQAAVTQGLDSLPDGALDADCTDPRMGVMPARKVLLIVAQHVAEHRGHAQLTLDLLNARLGRALEAR